MISQLTDQDISHFREQLRERFRTLRDQIRQELVEADHSRYSDLVGEVHDPEEESVADLLVDLEVAEIDRHVREIRDVEAALLRVARGTYGMCVDCEEPIARERLEANPTAARCLDCQAAWERRHPEQAPGHHRI